MSCLFLAKFSSVRVESKKLICAFTIVMRDETDEFGVEAEGEEAPVALLLLLFRPGGAPDMLDAERCCDDEPCLRPLLLLLFAPPSPASLLRPPRPGGGPPLI